MVDEKKKVKFLKDTKEILDKNNIEFFAIHGTLLGFGRNRKIIPWDVDIDIGAWYYDYDKVTSLVKDFEKIGYKMTFGSGKYSHTNITPFDEYNKKNGSIPFHIGIDFWIEDKDMVLLMRFFDENKFNKLFSEFRQYLNKNPQKKTQIKIFNFLNKIFSTIILYMCYHETYTSSSFKKLKSIKVYDMDIKVPKDYEKYLKLTYGPNWKVPDKNWSHKKWMKVHKAKYRYKIRDNKVRTFWIKRGNIKTDNGN